MPPRAGRPKCAAMLTADRDLPRIRQHRCGAVGRRAGCARRQHHAGPARAIRSLRGVRRRRARRIVAGLGRDRAGLRRGRTACSRSWTSSRRSRRQRGPWRCRSRRAGRLHFATSISPIRDGRMCRCSIGCRSACAPGEKLALVGPSGAGKSTIFQLILRFYDPVSGNVSFDGVRLTDADPAELRARIRAGAAGCRGFRHQCPREYPVRPSRRYRCGDRARRRKPRMRSEFIRRLPLGYETPVGERGVTLSGGQRQRIAIARAILRKAPLLLLDEATSSLDAESETLVQQRAQAVDAQAHVHRHRASARHGAVL